MRDEEFESVTSLPAAERYSYTIKRIADREKIWSLATKDGWALLGDDEGHELIPVWPHKRFAEVFTIGCWNNYEPRAVNLEVWMELYLPDIDWDRKMLAVFPVHKDEDMGVR